MRVLCGYSISRMLTTKCPAVRDDIKKGYGRIQEKIKEIRQNFSSAVVNGRRSGSGKIVFQHYDRLVKIYGETASSEPLPASVDTDTFNCANQNELIVTDEMLDEDLLVDVNTDTSSTPASKRKPEDACVIDNKRKHMERTLSAAQRDQLLLKESKEEMNFKKEMTEIMKESSKNTVNAISGMATAIENIESGFSRSIEMLAAVFAHQEQLQQQFQPQQFQPQQFHPQWPLQPTQPNN